MIFWNNHALAPKAYGDPVAPSHEEISRIATGSRITFSGVSAFDRLSVVSFVSEVRPHASWAERARSESQ
jgi:hypothetical protein